jgi:hypothetical protein
MLDVTVAVHHFLELKPLVHAGKKKAGKSAKTRILPELNPKVHIRV